MGEHKGERIKETFSCHKTFYTHTDHTPTQPVPKKHKKEGRGGKEEWLKSTFSLSPTRPSTQHSLFFPFFFFFFFSRLPR
jgi:hypothetical protein